MATLLLLLSFSLCGGYAAPAENMKPGSQVPAMIPPPAAKFPSADYRCGIQHLAADQKTVIKTYAGTCATNPACQYSYNGVHLLSLGCSKDGSQQCCIHDQIIPCAGKYSAYQCLNSGSNSMACPGGTWVEFTNPSENPCPGSARDDVKCCIPPKSAFSGSSSESQAFGLAPTLPAGAGAEYNNNNIPTDGPYDDSAPTMDYQKEEQATTTTSSGGGGSGGRGLGSDSELKTFNIPLPVGEQGFERYSWD